MNIEEKAKAYDEAVERAFHKAKAYDEALERAKRLYNGTLTNGLNSVDLEDIFPQLRESEDERMMRVIGLALTDVPEERFTSLGTTLKDCLAYLEKQKELPFEKDVMLGYPGLYFYDGERMHFRGPAMEEKQKEQKPAGWSEKHIADIFEKVGLAKIVREQGYYGWKPSKEQMEHLKRCFSHGKPHLPMPNQHVLESLYNDLKKLM